MKRIHSFFIRWQIPTTAFQNIFSEPDVWRPSTAGLSFKNTGEKAALNLEAPFSVEEVFMALSDLKGGKAPSLEAFWHFSRDFVREEVMGFFKEFYENNKFVRRLNSTFLVLIPKKEIVEDSRDYRPISLVESMYKILVKVLANRLKKVVGKVVSAA